MTYFFSGASREHKAGTKVNITSYLTLSGKLLAQKPRFKTASSGQNGNYTWDINANALTTIHYQVVPGPCQGRNFEKMKPAIRNQWPIGKFLTCRSNEALKL